MHNDTIFACTHSLTGPGAVYISADTGYTWQKYCTTPPYAFLNIDFNPNGRVFVATPNGAFYSDKQSAWIPTTGLEGTTWTVNYIGKDSIIYGDESNGIIFSKDNGVSAQRLNIFARRTFFIHDTIYAASRDELMYSKNLNEGWKYMNLNRNVNGLTKIQNKLFAATTEGVYFYDGSVTKIEIVKSRDISVFPNPTNGIFELIGIGTEKFSFVILNSKGQQVLKSQRLRNDISDFNPGIYILRMEYMNDIIISKIIKK